MKRRDVLRGAIAAAAASSLPLTLTSNTALAMPADYRALVCVFLLGGMDNHDTVIPFDDDEYNAWVAIRGDLIGQYNGGRSQANLLQLVPDNAADFGGRVFALPQQMTGMSQLFADGNLSVVSNVGPLVEPVNRAAFQAGTAQLPPRLFSHNDQQAVWMSSNDEGAQFGWGGFFADALLGLNTDPTFTAITGGGNGLFLTGNNASPYQVSLNGGAQIDLLQEFEGEFSDLMTEHFRAARFSTTNIIGQDVGNAVRGSFDANVNYKAALDGVGDLTTAFPASSLGSQLRAVARTIAARNTLGASRQIFIVATGGFDTHDGQATSLPGLHTQIDQALLAFYQAMTELNLQNEVTTFTASDFGRTL